MPIPALLAAAPGLLKAGASLFGAGKRKRAEAEAQARFDQSRQDLENFQFENPYANLENTAEDLTVNQQAANFQAAQTDQKLAQGLDAIVAGGGGGGDAQAIADAALGASQGASANLASQEQNIQSQAAQQAAANQAAEAKGASTLQTQQYGQKQQLFNLAQDQLSNAQAARQQATQQLVGGLSEGLGAGLTAADKRGVFDRQKDDSGLKRLYSPTKRDPEKKKYSGDRFERKKLLKQLLEQGGHTFTESEPGRYTIGGQQVTIDPTTGEFKGVGLAGKRAEEFFSRRAQGIYDKEYTRALKDAGLQAEFDPRGGAGNDTADAALAESIARQGGDIDDIAGAREMMRDADSDVYRTNEYSAGRLDEAEGAPLNRSPFPRNGEEDEMDDEKMKITKSQRKALRELRKEARDLGSQRHQERTQHIRDEVGDLRTAGVLSQAAGSALDPYNLNDSKFLWKSMGLTRAQAREQAKAQAEATPDIYKVTQEMKQAFLKDPSDANRQRLLEAYAERDAHKRRSGEVARSRGLLRKKDSAPTKRPLYRMLKAKFKGMYK